MANIRQILVDWTTISGAGKVSVLYFDATPAVATQRTALNTFLTATKAVLDNSCSYDIRQDGVEVDDTTGELTGAWSDPSAKSGTGTGGGEPVADATQVLVRFKTLTIINGRFLQGRMYIPGMASSNEVNGNVAAAAQATISTAANTFVGGAAALHVWHRPLKDEDGNVITPGDSRPATSANVWGEFAVLRRRRG